MSAIIGSIGEFDIPAMERAAYQRGDRLLADLLGRLIDTEENAAESVKTAEEASDEYSAALERATNALDEVHTQLTNELDAAPDKMTKAELAEFMVRLQKIADYAIEAYKRERL